MYKYILILAALLIFSSCQDNTPAPAEQMTKEKLLTTPLPGYQWFSQSYKDYTPNDSIINLIKTTFDATKDTILLFSKPACSCGGDESETFAQLVKVFDKANIPETNYKIYSMSSVSSYQPYKNYFTLNILPAYMVTYQGVADYSIYDTVYIEKTKLHSNVKSMEEYLLKAFEKF